MLLRGWFAFESNAFLLRYVINLHNNFPLFFFAIKFFQKSHTLPDLPFSNVIRHWKLTEVCVSERHFWKKHDWCPILFLFM